MSNTITPNAERPWDEVHPDYRSTRPDGSRWVLDMDPKTGGTALFPWVGPTPRPAPRRPRRRA